MAVHRATSAGDSPTRPEAHYRDAVEQAVQGVFRTTPDGHFVLANQALAQMLGFETAKELMADRRDLKRDQYVNPEDRERFKRLIETQRLVRGFEYQAYRLDRTIVWLRVHARVVDLEGRTYYEGTVEDVTQRRRVEELLDLRVRQQAAVARLGAAAISEHSLDALLERAVSLLVETLGVEFAQILERRPAGDLLVRSGVGWRTPVIGTVVSGNSLAGLTIESDHPILLDDRDPEMRARMSRHLREHAVVSGISVIIGPAERPYGVLGAYGTSPRRFTVDDVNFLQGIGNIVAAAVARLRDEELREHLIARAISAHEEERARIARELHDETGQALSAILVGLRNVEEADDLPSVRVLSEQLRSVTAQAIRDVGRIARGLRPSTLDDLGLVPALRRYAEDLETARHISVSITNHATARFRAAVETTLYRIIQEALTNVARHAQAQRVQVTIEQVQERVRATIRDDGCGFDVASTFDQAEPDRSLGLVGMQERASLLSGRVDISSRPSGGTQIVVELPLQESSLT